MAINFIKKEDLSHITRTTRQWETTIDRYEIIPKGVLCIELCNDKLTKIKIGNGHLIYEQLPYVSDVNLSDYYTKEETNNLIKNLKSIKIKGEASSLSDLPLRGNDEGDLWFVNKPHPDTHSRYDEYVWYNNKWESFGSSDIDLSEYAKKSYVDEHIQEVQNEITEIIESGYLHKHNNKNILDQTSAVYNVEKDNKLRDLHNYDDSELREKAHTHLNKNILDQTDAVYNRDKDDKLRDLHNYDDTTVKQRLSSLESVAHSHDNQDVLDRTTAAFTKEQALTLLDCKDFKGTDGVHDGYHGFVPAPTKDDIGKVLGANGEWVEGGSSGGDTITEGGGISITTDAQTGNKVISVNAGTGLEIDQQTGELYVTATGGDSIAEGNGIDITTDPHTDVKTISVDIGNGLQFNQNSEIDINTGDGLSINQNNELDVGISNGLQFDSNNEIEINTGEGLQINQNNELEVSLGNGLSINNNNAIELDKATTTTIGGVIVGDNLSIDNTGKISADEYTPGEGISIDSNKEVSVKYNSNGLSINASDELELDKATKNSTGGVIVGDNIDVSNGTISVPVATDSSLGVVNPTDGLSVDNTGELSVNTGDGLSINQDNEIGINIGEGLQFNQDNELEVGIGDGLSINASDEVELDKATTSAIGGVIIGDNIDVNDGTISVPKAASDKLGVVKPSDGLSVDSNGVLTVDTGDGLSIDSTTKEVNVNVGRALTINQNNDIDVNIASSSSVGVVKPTTGLQVDANGELTLKNATTTELGGVIVGDNIDVNNGTISVPKAASDKLGVVKPTDGLSIDNNGELSVNVGDGLSINQDNEIEVNVGDGLTVDANNTLKAKIGVGLHFNDDNAIEADEIDIDTYEPGNGISFIRHYARELPAGYTQLEYIESHFDAGFILDYYPQKTSKVVCEAAFVDVNRSTPSDNCLFGSRNGNSSSSKQFVLWFNDRTSSPFSVGFVYTGNSWGDIGDHPTNANMYQRLLFEISPSIGVYCNNVLIQNPLSHPDRDPSPYKLGILCLATSDTGIDTTRNYQSGRIFTFKIYESDTLVVDLVPCLNDSDVPGLYDMVGEVFYPSTSGTDFTYDSGAVVTHDSITIDANRGPGIIYDNNALSLNPGAGLSIDETDNQKLNVNLADGLSIKNTSTNAIKINTGDGLSVDSTTNKLNVNIGDGLVKDSSNNIDVNLYDNDLYIDSGNNQIRINPLYAPTYEAGNGVQFVSTSPYNLPPNYTKLSCVESKNTSSDKSAFRLNYVPTTETKFDVLFGITKASFTDVTIIGSGGSNTAKYSLNITRSSAATNNTTVRFNYCQDNSSTSVSFTTIIGDILHIVADKNGVYVNNNLVQTPNQTGSPSSYKLCVGSSPATNTAASFRDPSTPGKYYDIKIYEGNTLTVHLIPCLNDSNVPGMYDEVNEHFYHNEWKTDFHYDENEKTRPGYYVQAKLGNGLQFDANNAIEVVNGGTEYTAGDGIDINANDEISVKLGNHLSIDQTTGDINVDDIIEYTAGDGVTITLVGDDVFNNGDGWENLCYSNSTGNDTTGNYQWEIHSPISNSLTIPYGATQIKAIAKDTNDNLIWTSFSWIDSNDYHFASTTPNDGHYDDWFDIPSGSVKVNFGVRWTRLSVSQAISTSDVDSVTVMFDNGDTKRIDVNVGDGLFIDSTNNDVNVKIGQALSINNSNEIDVNLGRALSINNNNEIDVDIATANSLGVVKAGSGINIDQYGNISTQAAPFRIGRALSLDDESVRLPAGYAKAKYVENPGGAGKRTGFRPSDYPNARYVTSVSVNESGSSSTYPTRYVCGASGWTGSLSMPLDGVSGGLPIKTRFHIGNGNYPEYTTTTFQFGERFDLEASPSGGFKINNELVQAVATPPSGFGTYFLALFGSGASNGPGEPGFKGRMYYFRIYNTDDTLLANFVPAVRLGDNVVGFFNTVNNTFYSSETSTQFTTDMDDLDVDEPDWVLNAKIATSNSLGVVKPGTGMTVDEHGVLNVSAYQLPTASASTLGGVKIGDGVDIDENGVISVEAMEEFVPGIGLELIPGSSSVDALPEGYGKVDYIETNGSAYTIINYVPNRNSKVVGTAMFRTGNDDPVVFGCRKGGGNGQQFVLWFDRYSSAQAKVGFVYGTNTWSTSTDAADGKLITYTTGEQFSFLISVDDDCNINNTFVHNITDKGAPASDLHLGIFALAVTNSSIESDDTIFNGRMYDFKIYENDELVVNLVPAVRLLDEKVGFYDNINDVFYTSFSSNQFITDMSSMVIDYQDTTLNVRLSEGLKTNSSNDITLDLHAGNGINIDAYGSVLPTGYGELSYIEGNGNQWTQLNYYPTHDSRLVVDCISYETKATDRALFGCREGTGGQPQFVLWMGQNVTGKVTSSFVYGSNVWDDAYDTGVALGERFTIDASYNGVYVNGDLFESITDQGNMPNLKVALFTVGNGDGSYISGKGMGKYRIFSFKIYEGNDLVVDLRPALSPIRIPGFYDVVNDNFYSSLTSTAFVYDSGSVVYPSGLQLTTKLGDGLAYDANGAITVADSPDAFAPGNGISFNNTTQSNKIKLVISAIKNTSQSGTGAPYIQMRSVEFSDENMDPISLASGEAIWTDGTTVSYASSSETISAMIANTGKMCVEHFTQPLILTFTLSSPVYSENIKYFRYKTGGDASERDPVSWKIYVNDVNAQSSWTQISEGVSETITGNRNTWTQYFDCEFTAGGTTYINVIPATANAIGGVKIGNGLTVTSDGTISTATGKAYVAGEGIDMSSSQYEFSAENEEYLFKSTVTCELHGSFNREFQKTTDDTALGIVWNVYDSGTLWSGPIFVGLSSDSVKYTTNGTTYNATGTFQYLGKTWYYGSTQMYVSNIDGTDYDGNMVVDTETYESTSDTIDLCKSLIDRARVILKVDEISLLPATEDTLGGIKIGEGLSIDENNVVSSTVYEEGQGITFETSGSTDSFNVKNKEYYFEDEARSEITGNFGPRSYWRAYTDDPCLAVIFYRSDTTTAPLYIGITENSVKIKQSWDGNVLGPDGTFDYKGYTWYYTFNYGLYYSSGVDQQGHLLTISGTSADDLEDVAKHVIDLAELVTPGIQVHDVWNSGTGWLNGSYISGTSDTFATDWYKEYHSKNTEYFELPEGATEVKLTGISTSDTAFGGNHIDLFNDAKHHIGTFTGASEWKQLLTGTVYLQFGVKWNEQNTQDISGSQVKSVTLEIKVPKNNAITAKLGDGLTFDENDAITLDESIKLIIHCVGDPLT